MHIWFPAVVLKVCSTCFKYQKKLISHFLYKGRDSARRIGPICRSKSCSPINDKSRSIATCSMGTPANILAISSMALKRTIEKIVHSVTAAETSIAAWRNKEEGRPESSVNHRYSDASNKRVQVRNKSCFCCSNADPTFSGHDNASNATTGIHGSLPSAKACGQSFIVSAIFCQCCRASASNNHPKVSHWKSIHCIKRAQRLQVPKQMEQLLFKPINLLSNHVKGRP